MVNLNVMESSIQNPNTFSIIYSMALAFVLSTILAVTYQKTFQGLSYSRNYIQSLILSSIVTTLAMQAIGDNLARGMGMMGALAIIRFRSSLKDPKDMIFVFAALGVGMACGVYSFRIAVIGTIMFSAVAFVLHFVPFASEASFDGLLRFNIPKSVGEKGLIEAKLSKLCEQFALVTLRELAQGERLDYAYQIKLKRKITKPHFLNEFHQIEQIQGLNLHLQEATVEV